MRPSSVNRTLYTQVTIQTKRQSYNPHLPHQHHLPHQKQQRQAQKPHKLNVGGRNTQQCLAPHMQNTVKIRDLCSIQVRLSHVPSPFSLANYVVTKLAYFCDHQRPGTTNIHLKRSQTKNWYNIVNLSKSFMCTIRGLSVQTSRLEHRYGRNL